MSSFYMSSDPVASLELDDRDITPCDKPKTSSDG